MAGRYDYTPQELFPGCREIGPNEELFEGQREWEKRVQARIDEEERNKASAPTLRPVRLHELDIDLYIS